MCRSRCSHIHREFLIVPPRVILHLWFVMHCTVLFMSMLLTHTLVHTHIIILHMVARTGWGRTARGCNAPGRARRWGVAPRHTAKAHIAQGRTVKRIAHGRIARRHTARAHALHGCRATQTSTAH